MLAHEALGTGVLKILTSTPYYTLLHKASFSIPRHGEVFSSSRCLILDFDLLHGEKCSSALVCSMRHCLVRVLSVCVPTKYPYVKTESPSGELRGKGL